MLTIGVTLTVLLDSRLGNLGWHTRFTPEGLPVNDATFRHYGKAAFALKVLPWPCVGVQKISVLLFYKRIFIDPLFRTVVWYFIGFCVAWTIAFGFSVTFSCVPVTYEWDPTVKPYCIDQILLYRIALITDVIIDALILSLPVPNIWKLQMRTGQKFVIIGLFLLGGFTTVTGIIRLHFLNYANASLKHHLFNDFAYNYAPAFYWSTIETNVGILSACLPTLRPIFHAYPLTTSLSHLFKNFTNSFRSALHSSKADDTHHVPSASPEGSKTAIRLHSMEEEDGDSMEIDVVGKRVKDARQWV